MTLQTGTAKQGSTRYFPALTITRTYYADRAFFRFPWVLSASIRVRHLLAVVRNEHMQVRSIQRQVKRLLHALNVEHNGGGE
jgi:hypothetical protein